MENQYPAVTPANKSTYLGLGAKAGSLGFAGANLAYRLAGKGDLRFATPGGLLKSTFASALLGGALGAIGGANVTKSASANTAFDVKETDVIMNQELLQACEMAKLAADMSLPLEKKPAPEAGSQPVQGMTDNSTYSPTSVGASTYAGQVDAAALAKARAAAAMAMSKQAGVPTMDAIDAMPNPVINPVNRNANDVMLAQTDMHKKTMGEKMRALYAQGQRLAANNPKTVKNLKRGGMGLAAAATMYGAKRGYDAYAEKHAGVKEVKDSVSSALNNTKEYFGKNYAEVKRRATAAGQSVSTWIANNPKAVKGLKYTGAATAVAGAGYGAKRGYDAYKEKNASIEEAYEDYMDKLASVEAYGVTPEEAYFAAEAAVELYNDCLEKMAYAEELFNDADNYFAALEECEEFEKQAAEYMPIASSTLGALAGATAGYVAGAKFPAMRNGVAMAGMATGGAALGSALNQFKTASAWRAI